MKVTGIVVLVELLGTILAFCLGRPDVGVLVFQTIPMTALVAITYNYARSADKAAQSTDIMARATIELAQRAGEQLSFLETQRENEERIMLQDLRDELSRALLEKHEPPFDMSVWERHQSWFKTTKKFTEGEINQVVRCYGRMKAAKGELDRLLIPAQSGGLGVHQIRQIVKKFCMPVRDEIGQAMHLIEDRLKLQA